MSAARSPRPRAGQRSAGRLQTWGVALACACVLGALGPAAPAAQAAEATITVTVVDSVTGAPVGASCATATPFDPQTGAGSDVRQLCSATNVITFDTLVAGTQYFFYVSAAGHLGATVSAPGQGTRPAYVTAPAQVTATVVPAVTIGGQVTDSSGAPLDGTVNGTSTTGAPSFYSSLSGGRWQALAAPGTYTIEYQTTPGVWQESYAYGRRTAATADPIVVLGPGPVIVDQVVPAPSGLTGAITEAGTGLPIAGACIEVQDPATPGGLLLGYACADANGHYLTRSDVPTGTWPAQIYDPSGAHAAVALSVQAVSGRLTVVDVQLPVAATLTGRVVDHRTGAPIAGACPGASAGRTQELRFEVPTCSDASGNWSLTGLPAGQLTVYLSGDADHIGRWARNAESQATATLFTATAGRTTNIGTVRELHGATLTGRVTDAAGHPVANAFVSVGIASTFYSGSGPGYGPGLTDAQGRYTVTDIAPQKSVVEVQTPDAAGLAWQWSGRAADPANGRALTFRYEEVTRFDVQLRPEAELSVADGPSVTQNVSIDVETLSGTAGIGYHNEVSPASPQIQVHGLPASDVVVRLTDPSGTVRWYGGATRETATRVRLRAGRTTSIVVGGS